MDDRLGFTTLFTIINADGCPSYDCSGNQPAHDIILMSETMPFNDPEKFALLKTRFISWLLILLYLFAVPLLRAGTRSRLTA